MDEFLESVLEEAISKGATDIHLEKGQPIYYRVGSDLCTSSKDMDEELFLALQQRCGAARKKSAIESDLDQAFTYKTMRIRVHLYTCQSHPCATLRLLYGSQLELPDTSEGRLLRRIAQLKEGLVLIAGCTGSGKSYTLACCVEYLNTHGTKHIVTLEDPIEYVFVNKKALIHQRQLGTDIGSMAQGVRSALREDPDIIIIGELRDRETLEAALHAAETGHLVFATMHTQRAVLSIQRMISMFPGSQQEEVRHQISQVLRAVICQRLARMDGTFVTARDILLNTSAVANLIRQRKESQIVSLQETQPPMKTLEMSVRELQKEWGCRGELSHILEDDYEMV